MEEVLFFLSSCRNFCIVVGLVGLVVIFIGGRLFIRFLNMICCLVMDSGLGRTEVVVIVGFLG